MEPLSELEATLRLSLAALLGGLIGFDRERSSKAAGIRTHMLVSMGAALFMVTAELIAQDYDSIDPTRVAQGIVAGVGFIGAGQIFQDRDRVHGLTSAAGIWVTAAIGSLVGIGYYAVPLVATVAVFAILAVLGRVEEQLMPEDDRAAEATTHAESRASVRD
jgi:putative Mg2+ transporter-C (MgtC) family protein